MRLGTIRGAWGAVLLLDPALPLRLGAGTDTPGVRAAARILGARHLVESVLIARAHGRQVARRIAVIDAVHGLSMLGLAAMSRRLRRDALLSAASATALVAMGLGDSMWPGRG